MSIPATTPSTWVDSDVSRPAGVPPRPSVPIGSSCAPVMTGGVCVTMQQLAGAAQRDQPVERRVPGRAVGQPGHDERTAAPAAAARARRRRGRSRARPRRRARCGRRRRSSPRARARVPRRSPRRRAPSGRAGPGAASRARPPRARRRPASRRAALRSPRPAGTPAAAGASGLYVRQRDARPLRDVEQRLDAVVRALRRAAEAQRERRPGVQPAEHGLIGERRLDGIGVLGHRRGGQEGDEHARSTGLQRRGGLRGRRGGAAEAGGERERDERRRRRERARGEAEPGEHQRPF